VIYTKSGRRVVRRHEPPPLPNTALKGVDSRFRGNDASGRLSYSDQADLVSTPQTGYFSVTRSSTLAIIDLRSSVRSQLQRVLGGSRNDTSMAVDGDRRLFMSLDHLGLPYPPRSLWKFPERRRERPECSPE
jgi:hypothetical protein